MMISTNAYRKANPSNSFRRELISKGSDRRAGLHGTMPANAVDKPHTLDNGPMQKPSVTGL
jgi:hypothetical protein